MFRIVKTSLKLGIVSGKWAKATGIDPGDKGQVAKKAREYLDRDGVAPEEAWLTAMVHWMHAVPFPESKQLLARGVVRFLNRYEQQMPLSTSTVTAARDAATTILQAQRRDEPQRTVRSRAREDTQAGNETSPADGAPSDNSRR